MARRRLPPPGSAAPEAQGDPMPLMPFPAPGRRSAPLAQVAADSAAQAALREVAEELASARAEGRLLLALPLDAVEDGYLLRDPMVADPEEMDSLDETLPPMTHFILPRGHPVVSYCHITRTVCRRAERMTTLLHEQSPVPPLVLAYLNRLSDYLFVLARKLSAEHQADEIKWIPGGNRE